MLFLNQHFQMKNIIAPLFCFVLLTLPSAFLYSQPGADSLLNFIKQNKSRASLFLRKNDTVVAQLNEDRLMPLASTVKIIVAIEFAKQAAHNVFNKNEKIPLSELDKYYIPNTDGGAHPRWISYEKNLGNIINDSVKLIDVARGMIMFSSNANAEYLMDLLGFDNITNNLQLLGLKNTRPFTLLCPLYFYTRIQRNVNEDKIIRVIKKLSDEDYEKAAILIHRELKNDSNYKKKIPAAGSHFNNAARNGATGCLRPRQKNMCSYVHTQQQEIF